MPITRYSLRVALVAWLVIAWLALSPQSQANDSSWPQFRGPDGQGNVPGDQAPLEWGENDGVRWKTAIPGRGWSSPVVLGNQIWMTTAIEREGDENELRRRTEGLSTADAMALAADVSLRAVCVDRHTGELLHDVPLLNVTDPDPIHSLNSYASPTPVVEPGRLYCHFGRYGTVCLDTSDGTIVWQREFPIDHFVGPGSSPAVCGNLVVVTCDGADKQFIVALDKQTGETIWRKDRPPIRSTNPDFRKSYCTPLVIERNGQQQVVIPGAQWIVAYAPEDGRELWTVDHGSGFSVVPRPLADETHVYCCTGFVRAEILAIRLGGSGDISSTHVAWRHPQQVPTQPSPALHEGRLFMVSDNGIGQCLRADSGEVVWKKRLPGSYSASALRVGDRVYFFNRDGLTTVIDADTDDGTVLASNEVEGTIMATPAVVDGQMYLRTHAHLYAIGP